MNIIVYSKSNCPNCTTAKALLDSKGLDFIERSIEDQEWRDVFTRQYPDIRQMPQIFINGQRVGGLAGLQQALKQMEI
jgi:glutaredoxin 3